MAGGLGFEPRLAESESAVLPLDDPPSAGSRSLGPGQDQRRTRYHTGAPLCRGPHATLRQLSARLPPARPINGMDQRRDRPQPPRPRPRSGSATARRIARRPLGPVRSISPGRGCGTGLLLDLLQHVEHILVARRSASADLLTICATIASLGDHAPAGRFSKAEPLSRIRLPVRCQPVFWRSEFGCRQVRPNAHRALISRDHSASRAIFEG